MRRVCLSFEFVRCGCVCRLRRAQSDSLATVFRPDFTLGGTRISVALRAEKARYSGPAGAMQGAGDYLRVASKTLKTARARPTRARLGPGIRCRGLLRRLARK